MATTRNNICEQIEAEVRLMTPDGVEVECQQDFDTKDCIVRITTGSNSHDTRLTMEDIQDLDWRQIIRTSNIAAGIIE